MVRDAVALNNAPTSDMRYPKNGIHNATITCVATKNVLMKILKDLFFWYVGNQLSVVIATGFNMSAYFANGVTNVV